MLIGKFRADPKFSDFNGKVPKGLDELWIRHLKTDIDQKPRLNLLGKGI